MMEIKSLKEIASLIRTGKTPPTKEDKYFNGEINWYSPGDLDKTKYLFTAKRTITQQAIEDKKAITFPKDTLLVGCIGDIGKLGITSELSSSNQQLTGILPNNETNVSYLYYWFKGNKKVLENYSNNAVVPILNNRTLETVKIPLPPLDQQKKIAAILDAADAYKQKTKALITKYDELTQSLFLEMFGELEGDKVSLSSICEVNPKKSQISSLDRSLKVSFVPMANVSEEGELSLVEERTIDEVWSGFTYFQEDDVVFAKITPCMENGKGAIMRGLKNKIGFGTTEFHVLRPTNDVSCSEYLFYLTHSSHFRVLAELNMKGSAGQKRVPKDFFDRYKVVAPSIALQNQFAERVQAIESQKKQAQTSLVQSENLFNSLLQRAFKGELV